MARGDVQLSPWTYDSGGDYLDRHITISVPFDESTRAIGNGTLVHRDVGCLYTHIVFDDPSDTVKIKRLPVVPEGDTTLTAQRVRQLTGFRTIEDVMAVQVTAEP
jgi:hypothetical protein